MISRHSRYFSSFKIQAACFLLLLLFLVLNLLQCAQFRGFALWKGFGKSVEGLASFRRALELSGAKATENFPDLVESYTEVAREVGQARVQGLAGELTTSETVDLIVKIRTLMIQ